MASRAALVAYESCHEADAARLDPITGHRVATARVESL
jgi:hypothetical protein